MKKNVMHCDAPKCEASIVFGSDLTLGWVSVLINTVSADFCPEHSKILEPLFVVPPWPTEKKTFSR